MGKSNLWDMTFLRLSREPLGVIAASSFFLAQLLLAVEAGRTAGWEKKDGVAGGGKKC